MKSKSQPLQCNFVSTISFKRRTNAITHHFVLRKTDLLSLMITRVWSKHVSEDFVLNFYSYPSPLITLNVVSDFFIYSKKKKLLTFLRATGVVDVSVFKTSTVRCPYKERYSYIFLQFYRFGHSILNCWAYFSLNEYFA